jgi:hypothetical protein
VPILSRISASRVGDAQQRLRQAHQRHPLLAGQRVFADQPVHRAARALGAHRLHQPARQILRLRRRRRRHGRQRQQVAQAIRLAAPVGVGDRRPHRRLRPHVAGEGGENHGQ